MSEHDPVTDNLLTAVGMALREDREALERQIAAVRRDASDATRPALDAAEARRALLMSRRGDTIETLRAWLQRCVADA